MNDVNVNYSGHQQNFGDIGPVQNGVQLGTVGQALRLEGLKIWLETVMKLGVGYGGHVQDIGWQQGVKDGELCGTTGQSLRLEAVKIWLTGDDAEKKSIQYQVHVAKIGWMNWVKDGEETGSEGFCDAIEAIRIVVTDKGVDLNTDTTEKFVKYVVPVPQAQAAPAAPAQGQKSGKVYLAVGHGISSDGSWDCGCVDGNYTEADLMLAIGKVAAARLRNLGFTVLTDADTDNDKNIAVCVPEANNWGADVYVSLHCDYNAAPSGTLPIVYPESDDGIRLANCLIASVQARLGLGTRGIIQRDDWEVADTNMTACIFETGGIRPDIGLLTNAVAYGEAVTQGIYDWF